ncbi:MAG: ROK family protein [Hyphomonas sp.]
MDANLLIAGVELGGTKSIALIAKGTQILDQVSIPTTTPDETLARLCEHLERWYQAEAFEALGIASFGPLQLLRSDANFGAMLPTPKPNWTGAQVAATLTAPFNCPWTIDTDVNGAALAEYRWGAGAGCNSVCYITIGTGLGGGLVINGEPVHGAMHPELGHIRIRRAAGDVFPGACPCHSDCIEGLVSGPALTKRFGMPASAVEDTHPAWDHVADDLSELICIILLTVSAQRILIGGGVSGARPFLLSMVRERVIGRLGGYLPFANAGTIDEIIKAPALGDRAGPLGAVALAFSALGR